jgi:DnaJ-class molecular chaperone
MSDGQGRMQERSDGCQTCYGTGEIVTEHGAVDCPDCYGDGVSANRGNKMEWRLRELEKTYRSNHASFADVMWLVHEVRKAREALVLILTRCQDADDGDDIARYARTRAMEALGLYERAMPGARAAREDVEKV